MNQFNLSQRWIINRVEEDWSGLTFQEWTLDGYLQHLRQIHVVTSGHSERECEVL